MNAFDRRMKAASRHTSGNWYFDGASLRSIWPTRWGSLADAAGYDGVADGDPNSGESGYGVGFADVVGCAFGSRS
ncbi:hypothetical protein RBSH_01574 [Rhodopirellula baltica SH28]|uniref:Uncharacterized protein n=1 Tax=Rhodopirellula baltica SH28 TaxID=993517 RepID=K5EB97_RHOBT|nr:hypothetical protein RBSH_01574 [Rhodopirellula baltica SH28]